MKPINFGVFGYNDFRKNQLETIQKILSSDKKFVVVSAPTGSGKTLMATCLNDSRKNYVSIIVDTNAVLEQYTHAVRLEGMENYCCNIEYGKNASNCKYANDRVNCGLKCKYIPTKQKFMSAKIRATNYYLFNLFSNSSQFPQTDILVLDEAHKILQIIISMYSLKFNLELIEKFKMRQPPIINNCTKLTSRIAINWINELNDKITNENNSMEKTVQNIKKIEENKRIQNKIQNAILCFDVDDDVYLRSDGKEIIIKPFSVYNIFNHLFGQYKKVVLMSGTISEEMVKSYYGITDFDFIEVENNFEQWRRPFFAFKDSKQINYNSSNIDKLFQVNQINKILSMFPDWSGIIHCKSKSDALFIYNELNNPRCWMQRNELNTKQSVADFKRKKAKNKIAITYSWQEGVDFPECKICIIQKVPYNSLSDEYSRLYVQKYPKNYKLAAALTIEQAAARTRRGNESDYDTDMEKAGFVCILDNSYNSIKHLFSRDFLGTIQVMDTIC